MELQQHQHQQQQQNPDFRMLMVDDIIKFLGVNQTPISTLTFKKRLDFEIRESYDYEANCPKEGDLYKVQTVKVMNEYEMAKKKVKPIPVSNKTSNSISLFSDEQSESIKKMVSKVQQIEKPISKNISSTSVSAQATSATSSSNSIGIGISSYNMREYNNLYESFRGIFGEKIGEYKFVNKNTRNKSSVFTFLDSLLTVMNEIFIMKKEDERIRFVKYLLKRMHTDVYSEGNYQKFLYHKSRKMKKETLQLVLNQSLNLRVLDMDNFFMLQQYATDFFGINLFVFNIKEGENEIDYEKSRGFRTKQFGGVVNRYVPTILMMLKDEVFYAIIHEMDEKKSVFKYSEDEDIIKNVWKNMRMEMIDEIAETKSTVEITTTTTETTSANTSNTIERPKYKLSDLKNLKLDELQQICQDMGINIQKVSEKTGKMLKKTKTELMEEIIHYS